ncbi:MAG: hypothetical protein IT518_21030 [Burkholderiales bacterium]|nr:hypothetical protein [Burkholderiales bacterium]
MRVTLAAAQLLAAPAAVLSSLPAYARLAAYAGTAAVLPQGLDAAVIAAAGLPRDTPVAPLAARGAGFDPGEAYVLRADPVSLVAGRDDVLLGGRIADLTLEEACAIVRTLNDHFAEDGLAFHAPRADAWFVTARSHVPVETTPLALAQGALHSHLPRGAHAVAWRRWWSEMQMLLHAHPVNATREAAGRVPVTALWLAEGGAAASVSAAAAVYATQGAHGDVARGIVGTQAAPAAFAALAAAADAVVVLPAGDPATFARGWLDPALSALARGTLSELIVIADGDGRTLQWRAVRPSLLLRLRARIAGPARVLP